MSTISQVCYSIKIFSGQSIHGQNTFFLSISTNLSFSPLPSLLYTVKFKNKWCKILKNMGWYCFTNIQGRKEMLYLMTHSTHTVKDHSDSERGNPLQPHGLLFSINSKSSFFFYMHHPRQDTTYHGLCYTSRGTLAGTRNSSMGPPHKGSIQRPIAPWANALTRELHLAPHKYSMFK